MILQVWHAQPPWETWAKTEVCWFGMFWDWWWTFVYFGLVLLCGICCFLFTVRVNSVFVSPLFALWKVAAIAPRVPQFALFGDSSHSWPRRVASFGAHQMEGAQLAWELHPTRGHLQRPEDGLWSDVGWFWANGEAELGTWIRYFWMGLVSVASNAKEVRAFVWTKVFGVSSFSFLLEAWSRPRLSKVRRWSHNERPGSHAEPRAGDANAPGDELGSFT